MNDVLTSTAEKSVYQRIKCGMRKWMILTYGCESDWRKVVLGGHILVQDRESKEEVLVRVVEVERLHLFSSKTDAMYVGIEVC